MGYARPFLTSYDSNMYDIHIHASYEFYFLDEGNVEFNFENMRFTASDGDIFIIPPFTFHMMDAKGKPYKRHVSHFDEENIKTHSLCSMPIVEYISQFNPFYIHLNEDQCEVLRKMIKKQTEYEQTPSKFQYFNEMYAFCSILKYVAEIHIQNGSQKADFTRFESNTFPEILKFLHKNYTNDITPDEVAKKFKISKTTLYRKFMECVGISFKEYMIRLRITKSMELLKKGISVTEAANFSGFNSYAHFIRIFKERVGVSPKQYALRESNTKSDDYLRYLSN